MKLSIKFAVFVFFGCIGANHANAMLVSQKPSFDCSKAKSPVEQGICNNAKLSKMDFELAQIYAAVKVPGFVTQSDKSKSQREWIKQRNSCVSSKKLPLKSSEIECISLNYEARIIALSQSAILDNYFLAEEMLATYAHDQLPYYRALKHYMTMPHGVERNEKIESDLSGEIGKLDGEYEGYVKSVLADYGVSNIADGLKDDEKFGYLLSILSSIDVGPLVLPCKAFVEKPKMMTALWPVFGSTRDNFLARSDCEIPSEMVKFNEFLKATNKSAPFCDGTMRFAIYKSHQLHIEEILLGRFEQLREKTFSYYDYLEDKTMMDKNFNSFLKKNNALQKAAAVEIKNFWDKNYPNNEIKLPEIEDNLASLALGDMIGC